MLSSNGLMLEERPPEIATKSTDGDGGSLARVDDSYAKRRVIVRHSRHLSTDTPGTVIPVAELVPETDIRGPVTIFSRLEGATEIAVTTNAVAQLENNLFRDMQYGNSYRSQRVFMHVAVWIIALVNIAMSIVLVWIWNFKPKDFADTRTYLCELHYEQTKPVDAPGVGFSPSLVYRPALLFGSWVMMPYAIITIGSIALLLRALVLYMASSNFLRSLERNPQLSYDIWGAVDRMPNAEKGNDGERELVSLPRCAATVRVLMLMNEYHERTELYLYSQFRDLRATTRDTFYRSYSAFLFFISVFTAWYYFCMIHDVERFVGLANNPIGYRSHFRMGLIDLGEDIDAHKGAGLFGTMNTSIPSCIPKHGLDWKDVPRGSVDYDIHGIVVPSNLVNLWICCAVHLLSAALISAWAYGHVVAMGPQTDMTRHDVYHDHLLQAKIDMESEYYETQRLLRESDYDDRRTAAQLAKVGIDWDDIDCIPVRASSEYRDDDEKARLERSNEVRKVSLKDIQTVEQLQAYMQQDRYTEIERDMFSGKNGPGPKKPQGPHWKWSIPLAKEPEMVHWNICSRLCGDLRRTWAHTIARRFKWAVEHAIGVQKWTCYKITERTKEGH